VDLGESVFPEPEPPSSESKEGQKFVESQEPPRNESSAEAEAPPQTDRSNSKDLEVEPGKAVTTRERKPMKVPESVHVRITPERLKDYVGPPIYHKDRMYVHAPPPGVSSGLGYLGNGSGALMPIEVTVRPYFFSCVCGM
jgi:Lon-like ATP-dependent protease